MDSKKIWRVLHADPALKYIFQHELGVSSILAELLAGRGIATVDEARMFLDGTLDMMHDPFLMKDMVKAVERIKSALINGEKILVYGDYDADGITAAALTVKVLSKLGGKVACYLPSRMEDGYGLHLEPLRRAGQAGCSLVITVDCGISAFAEVACVREEKGPDIIITDHHECPDQIPGAAAVINPKQPGCPYPYKELAGVGVALKLAQALLDNGGQGESWRRYLDLACLGTVADIVPLTGENRLIVKYGLTALINTNNPGIKSLISVSGIKPGHIKTREIGFALAPRLNAAGRIGDPGIALDLLLKNDPAETDQTAALLNKVNQERQKIESLVLADAMGMIDADPAMAEKKVIVLAAPGWHPGVLGIVASRLVKKYYRPVLMITIEDSRGKGSGRSIPGFNLYSALKWCGEILTAFGGHAQAAGVTLPAGQVAVLDRMLNEYAGRFIDEKTYIPGIEVDAVVSLQDINTELVNEIKKLAPFGHGNPEPLLACSAASLLAWRKIGGNESHLKLIVADEKATLDGIGFNLASCAEEIAAAGEVDVAFIPSVNSWRGQRSIQLKIKDIRPSGGDWERPANPGFAAAGEQLINMGPLAVLPQFISAVLDKYGEVSANFSFPGKSLSFFSRKKLISINQTVDLSRMIKKQYYVYRPGVLLHLAAGCSRTLVLVDSPVRAVELAVFLSRSGIKADFIHSRRVEKQSDLFQKFNSGQLETLVIAYGSVPDYGLQPLKGILFDIPYSPGELEEVLPVGTETHVLFGDKEFSAGMEYLESVAPDRTMLGKLYTYLRRKGAGHVHWRQAVDFLRRCGLSAAGLHTLAFGFSVFADLGLLRCRREGSRYYIDLVPVKNKRDLGDSPLFVAGREIKSFSRKWWKELQAGIRVQG